MSELKGSVRCGRSVSYTHFWSSNIQSDASPAKYLLHFLNQCPDLNIDVVNHFSQRKVHSSYPNNILNIIIQYMRWLCFPVPPLTVAMFYCSVGNGDTDLSSEVPELGDHGEFKCDKCPRSFQWKSNLIRHQVGTYTNQSDSFDYQYIVVYKNE